MALKSIQLCHMDPEDRERSKFTVTVHFDDGYSTGIDDEIPF